MLSFLREHAVVVCRGSGVASDAQPEESEGQAYAEGGRIKTLFLADAGVVGTDDLGLLTDETKHGQLLPRASREVSRMVES